MFYKSIHFLDLWLLAVMLLCGLLLLASSGAATLRWNSVEVYVWFGSWA